MWKWFFVVKVLATEPFRISLENVNKTVRLCCLTPIAQSETLNELYITNYNIKIFCYDVLNISIRQIWINNHLPEFAERMNHIWMITTQLPFLFLIHRNFTSEKPTTPRVVHRYQNIFQPFSFKRITRSMNTFFHYFNTINFIQFTFVRSWRFSWHL